MTNRTSWNDLTDPQKREEIALRLGWIPLPQDDPVHRDHEWQHQPRIRELWRYLPNSSGQRCLEFLYDWPTNDGLAFEEVWPRICSYKSLDECWLIERNGKRRAVIWMQGSHTEIEADSDTWADAICHAAYELLTLAEVEGTK